MRGVALRLAAPIGIAAMVLAQATSVFADETDHAFSAYRADVRLLKERMLTWCEANPAALESGLACGDAVKSS